MKKIEEIHKLLDKILLNKEFNVSSYYEIDFYTVNPIVVDFKLTSPSGKVYTGLGSYKLYEVGTWYYNAVGDDKQISNSITITEDMLGKYATCELNM